MTTITIDYKPHEKQNPFHESTAKYVLFSAGVGSGKTAAGANEMIKWGMRYPSTYLLMAPTTKMLENVTLTEFFKFCPKELILKYNRSKMIIDLINGTKLICLSGETEKYIDRARGLNLGGWWLDEGSQFPAYVMDVLIGRLRNDTGPLRGMITTTQKGKGWLYKYFIDKTHPISMKKLPHKDQFEIFFASSHDNPHTPQEFKDSLESQYAGSFRRQEIYGEFAAFEGMVYMDFTMNNHVISIPNDRKFNEVQGWVDWGYKNPMVCLWVGIDGDKKVHIIDEFYKSLITMEEFLDYCEKRSKEFTNFTKFVADPSEPEHINQFTSKGLYCEEANNSILPGITRVMEYLKIQKDKKPRLFIDKDCINTINEFQMYSYAETKEGKPQLEKPVKLYDHAMDAIRYGIMAIPEESEVFVGFTR